MTAKQGGEAARRLAQLRGKDQEIATLRAQLADERAKVGELLDEVGSYHDNHHDAVEACVATLQAEWDAMLAANLTERDNANKERDNANLEIDRLRALVAHFPALLAERPEGT